MNNMEITLKLGTLFRTAVLVATLPFLLTACDVPGDKGRVYKMCVKEVTSRLKAPSTAVFGSFGESRVIQNIKEFPNDGVLRADWKVSGFVDAQNSFGAQIRSSYTCEFKQWKTEIEFVSADLS